MNILIIAHVGETLGHVIRGLSIAEALRSRGYMVTFASSESARRVIESCGFSLEPVEWRWSHNASDVESVTPAFAQRVLRTLDELVRMLRRRRPDLVIGLPGLASIQPAWAAGIEHVSVVHGPYLAPLADASGLDSLERKIVALAARVCLGSVNQMFRLAQAKLRLPAMSYETFVTAQQLLVPHPGYHLTEASNIRRVGFIRASYGGPAPVSLQLGRTCYVTFGSGNPCNISQVVTEASSVFQQVLVTTGSATPSLAVPRNAIVRSEVASAALGGKVAAVISHGGLGTIGTFAETGTPQLIIPTELDQAITAIFAVASGVGEQYGLRDFATRTSLGRRLPAIEPSSLRAAVLRLRDSRPLVAADCNGALEIATHLSTAGQSWSRRTRAGHAG